MPVNPHELQYMIERANARLAEVNERLTDARDLWNEAEADRNAVYHTLAREVRQWFHGQERSWRQTAQGRAVNAWIAELTHAAISGAGDPFGFEGEEPIELPKLPETHTVERARPRRGFEN